MGSRCILEVGNFSAASPTAQHPREHPRWCRHPAQELTWVVPCACASDSNYSPPLRAARAQGAWSQKPARALRSPATPLHALPRATPVCILLHPRRARSSSVSSPDCCPNWSIGKRQGWRAQHGRHRALGPESAWRAASAQEKLFLPGTTIEVHSHALAFPKASPQGPRRCPSRPRLSAFPGSSHTF